MNTIEELEEQSRLAIIAYLSDTENVSLEFAIISDNPDNRRWQASKGKINTYHCYYRIAPKKLWYKVALCCSSGEYYTITVDSDGQSQQCELRADFIRWLTPDKVYYTVETKNN
jgi:hypothetical protein